MKNIIVGITGVFIVQLIGSQHFADVATIEDALSRIPTIEKVWISRETQGLVELTGVTAMSDQDIEADMTALAADRFVVEPPYRSKNLFIVPLRKISSNPQ